MNAEPQNNNLIEIYTDGACSGNPGPGGWGVSLQTNGHEREMSGGEHLTTNNRMELTAAIKALNALKRPSQVRINTDSVYLRDGITKWITKWIANDWRTAARKPVKNVDLWKELDLARAGHKIDWCWTKGHAGNAGNERADELARAGMAPFQNVIKPC